MSKKQRKKSAAATTKKPTAKTPAKKQPRPAATSSRTPIYRRLFAVRTTTAQQREHIRQLLSIGGRLAAVCAASAVVLGLVNAVTAPAIEENRRRAFQAGIQSVLEEARGPEPAIGDALDVAVQEGVRAVYPAWSGAVTAGREPAAYVADLVGLGYGGDMRILAGYYPDGELFAARLMENTETPGLGKKAEDPQYMDKFAGHGAGAPIPTAKNELPVAEADAITGATVTFMGIAQALETGRRTVQSVVEQGE